MPSLCRQSLVLLSPALRFKFAFYDSRLLRFSVPDFKLAYDDHRASRLLRTSVPDIAHVDSRLLRTSIP